MTLNQVLETFFIAGSDLSLLLLETTLWYIALYMTLDKVLATFVIICSVLCLLILVTTFCFTNFNRWRPADSNMTNIPQ